LQSVARETEPMLYPASIFQQHEASISAVFRYMPHFVVIEQRNRGKLHLLLGEARTSSSI
jgi:hypothetical protein